MSIFASDTENADRSKNYLLGIASEGNPEVSANAFINNYKDKDSTFSSAGATASVTSPKIGTSVTAHHIPSFGNQTSLAGTANITQGPNHRVDVNASTTRNFPKLGPNFSSHGVGVSAEIGKIGANASIAHTPMFKMTERSIGGHLNLHQSPTSSVTLGVGANRTCIPGNKCSWQPGASFGIQKRF